MELACEKSYAPVARYTKFYSGGDIAWSVDGSKLYCQNEHEIAVVDVKTSQIVERLCTGEKQQQKKSNDDDDDADAVLTFALTGDHLVSAHRSGLLRYWQLSTHTVLKLWKAQHKGPIVRVQLHSAGQLVASSGSDAVIRLWDVENNTCIYSIRGYAGPAQLIEFNPTPDSQEIYAVDASNAVHCWNYQSKQLVKTLRQNGHMSQVTGLCFVHVAGEGQCVATAGRDKVLIVWRAQANKLLPLYEELTGLAVGQGTQQLLACTSSGQLLVIDPPYNAHKLLTSAPDTCWERLLYCASTQQLALISSEQNISIYDASTLSSLSITKQLIGYNDEINEICLAGEDERYLVVATNSKHFKIYDTKDHMNCKLICGHQNTVMSVCASQNLLLSASKDATVRLWQLQPASFELQLLAQQTDCHTAPIGSIAFAAKGASEFASVSADGVLKLWHISGAAILNRYAGQPHQKQINAVCYAPNNLLLATASQDKTAQLYCARTGTSRGRLSGHTRGVWCARFHPTDQILLTASADCSLRLWSITELTCLKRFEQDSTILRAEFIDNGKYILSSASDGMLKIWSIKANTCVQLLDEHEDRVYSLAVSSIDGGVGKYFYSGGADSTINHFVDATEAARTEQYTKRQETLEQEQTLQNLLHQQTQLNKAFLLALKLGKPKTSFEIVRHYVRARDEQALKALIDQLDDDNRLQLLSHVKAWMTNTKQSRIANVVLQHLVGESINDIEHSLFSRHNVEVLMPYVKRHFDRTTELKKGIAFLQYMVDCM